MPEKTQTQTASSWLCLIIMGVSGSGKSAVAANVAQNLSLKMLEADAFHSPENRNKMNQGIPLTDRDREGWLQNLNREMRHLERQHTSIVLACSALKENYRQLLMDGLASPPQWFLLHGPEALIRQRMDARKGHFVGSSLLPSQLETLEIPPYAYALDIRKSVGELTREIILKVKRPT